jgi:hypothetical protein
MIVSQMSDAMKKLKRWTLPIVSKLLLLKCGVAAKITHTAFVKEVGEGDGTVSSLTSSVA